MNFNPICALFLARSNSTGHEILLKMGVNPVEFIGMIPNSTREAYKCNPSEFTPIFSNISCPVEFDRARNTAKNGSKAIEMIPNLSSISCPIELGVNP